jgi:Signal transduction histidine kinase
MIPISMQVFKISRIPYSNENPKLRWTLLSFQAQGFGNFIQTKTVLSNYQLKAIIRDEFKKKNIKQPFEYCITNEAFQPTMFSAGYQMDFRESPYNYTTGLTDGTSANIEVLNIYIPQPENYFYRHLFTLLVFAFLFTSIIVAAYVLMIKTLFSQKRLSEIKSDFINNMTHEFKTPIATIQLASDALNNEKVIGNADMIKYYRDIIHEENRRMNMQVEKILQAASMEKDEIKMQMKKINVHEKIQKIAENFELQMNDIEANFSLSLKATKCIIDADEVHFTNIIVNLLENAVKYSKDNPFISIETQNVKNTIQIAVKDNGIGMDKETQSRIYEKFYRAHTGNLHNVKGFGLGLTYVKKIVDAHKGKIDVSSELGKGSTFTLSFACNA